MIEAQIRQAFGVASESTAQAERERLQGMVEVLREGTARQTPRQILELVDRVSPGCLVLLPSALKSADEASGFEYGEKLFDYVWKLATDYRQLRLQGGPDVVATQVFGNNVWAAKESQTTAQNAVGKAERTGASHFRQNRGQGCLKVPVSLF